MDLNHTSGRYSVTLWTGMTGIRLLLGSKDSERPSQRRIAFSQFMISCWPHVATVAYMCPMGEFLAIRTISNGSLKVPRATGHNFVFASINDNCVEWGQGDSHLHSTLRSTKSSDGTLGQAEKYLNIAFVDCFPTNNCGFVFSVHAWGMSSCDAG